MTAPTVGRRAETLAAWWLRIKGYRILERNYITGRGTGAGEVDIIAKRGGTVVFVEVKRRPSRAAAAEAIRPQARERITRAAASWLARSPTYTNCHVRFDAVLITPRAWPHHIPDAWREGWQ